MSNDQKPSMALKFIPIIGAFCCLAVALFGLGMIFYWHHVTGDWLDDHILFWQPIGIACLGGVFFFIRVLAAAIGRGN